MSTNKTENWNPDKKLNSSLIQNETDSGVKCFCMFLIELLGVKTNSNKNLLRILGVNILTKLSTFHSHISAVLHLMLFTISGICGIFAITLIWIVQNYLQLLLCLVVSVISIHFCMVSRTLTKTSNVFKVDWPALWQNYLHLLTVFHCFFSLHWLPVNLEYCSRTVCWPTNRFMKNSLFIFTPC